MNWPPAVVEVILEILRYGLLRARAAGWSGDAARSAMEADHLHNLPTLLANYKLDLLKYYWDAERPAFIQACSRTGNSVDGFNPLWEKLEHFLKTTTEPALTK
jgi:hypothetical protein